MLGDLIAEQLAGLQRPSKDAQFETTSSLSPKVLEVYREVGVFMSSYRSGKVPKPFKILPSLSNWEEILFVTEPEKWTPAAMFVATRLFASNLNESGACKFYSYILVPRCRLDIEENGRLNFHLYHALKKATYKPGAFFKGIILPLCTAGDCSLKEAVIFGSVMKKVSIPVLHSAAAMVKMSGMHYSPCQSIFFATLLDKKYSLPMRVIKDVLEHINVSSNDDRALPLKWHLMVLTFVQR
jgi:essential nuclear protein 1